MSLKNTKKFRLYKMEKEQLKRNIEHLFCFWPIDNEEIIEVINDLIDFIEQILGKDIKQEKIIIELKDKINEILY